MTQALRAMLLVRVGGRGMSPVCMGVGELLQWQSVVEDQCHTFKCVHTGVVVCLGFAAQALIPCAIGCDS